jgi:hypothetical protein
VEDLLWGIEPAMVLASVLAIGGAVLGMAIKINRCIGRQEADLKNLKNRFDIFITSYMSHIDNSGTNKK